MSSPTFAVSASSTVSTWYYHGQRDAGDDASGDFFDLENSTDGGATLSPLVRLRVSPSLSKAMRAKG